MRHETLALLRFSGEITSRYKYNQHPGNLVPTDHLKRQRKFRMDCIIPYLWVFQTQRGHRKDWQINYLETHRQAMVLHFFAVQTY